MSGLLEQGRWLEAYRILASGDPPIMFQLLVFFSIMMVFWLLRRLRGLWTMMMDRAIGLQVALLVGNIVILLNPELAFTSLPTLPRLSKLDLPI